jgi:inosine/xanthosine triphosphatase
MKTIVIASTNPVKAQAALNGFRRMFPAESFEILPRPAPSGVSDQPMTSAETLLGALNRAAAVKAAHPQADFWVGIEGGVEEDGGLAAFAWVAVLSPVGSGKARTGTFFLPPAVAHLVRQGIELGEADDIVFGATNSKQQNGAIGLLTGDVIDRAALYEHAVVLALVAIRNPGLYAESRGDARPDVRLPAGL